MPLRGVTHINIGQSDKSGKHLRLTVQKHNSHLVKKKKTIGFGLGDSKRFSENWKEVLKPGR